MTDSVTNLERSLQHLEIILSIEPSSKKVLEEIDEVRARLKESRVAAEQAVATAKENEKANVPRAPEAPVAPPNPATVKEIKASNQAANLAKAASELVAKDANIPNSPPKSSFEFERARHQLRNDMGGFAKYLLNLKPKQLPKLLKENLTEEMLSAVVRAVSWFANQK